MNLRRYLPLLLLCCVCSAYARQQPPAKKLPRFLVLRNITLIDGTGAAPKKKVSLAIEKGLITKVLPAGAPMPADARIVDGMGKTVMPTLVAAHAHLGLLKGNESSPANYTFSNVVSQLKKYESFGVTQVLSLGMDQPSVFQLRDASQQERLPGATFYTAGYGIGAKEGPPPASLASKVLRPETPEEAVKAIRQLAELKVDFVKIWVDGTDERTKLPPAVYEAAIAEAHRNKLRVAAHVYYQEDARRLVNAGVDVLAHSIRDQEVDDALITAMKEKGTAYIPTLSLDEYNFVYAGQPEWLNDPFFKASLEPGVWEMLISDTYKQQQQKDPAREKKMQAFLMAQRNLHKLDSAGVKIIMGTDSGAFPVRAQGFSEHLELQLMTEAGMTPLEAITAATRNGAEMLHIDQLYGTLQPGKKADFMVLDGDPTLDIRNTRKILEVWRSGKKVK
ncbi:amidohydrolase family protein [Chitinophaga japonensis]|uniref:Imidazolonepropionase-like amidohydrolase n=1 Tax=Chitinophaga japonensis TaxID=104662 RepID=A0A562T6C3_CHIJA|nr:amidohydrolase family protein [Chitinophaga japonensis]TWI89089.1 imidazolonepropionase-like amidohydrolase [Chitinophaga japonensis]